MISLGSFATKIFGSSNDRRLKSYQCESSGDQRA